MAVETEAGNGKETTVSVGDEDGKSSMFINIILVFSVIYANKELLRIMTKVIRRRGGRKNVLFVLQTL